MIDATDTPDVGRCLAVHMGIEWARQDAIERLDTAFSWLAKGGNLHAVAQHLQGTVVFLEQAAERPLELLEMRLRQQVADLKAIVAARTERAA